jgi:hypothetical protein
MPMTQIENRFTLAQLFLALKFRFYVPILIPHIIVKRRCILEGFWPNEMTDYMVVYNTAVTNLTHTSKWIRFYSSYQDHSIYSHGNDTVFTS